MKQMSGKNSPYKKSKKQQVDDEILHFSKYEDIEGKLAKMAKTHQGSRQLQKFFAHSTEEVIEKVVQEIITELPEMAKHNYGNYMF